MKKIFFIAILTGAFGLKPVNGFSQGLLFFHDTLNPHRFLFEAEIGMGAVNHDYGQMSYSFHTGFKNYVVSARFHRSEKGADFIFENSWLGGYRFNPARNFDVTFSGGVDDIAFVRYYDGSSQRIDREIAGFTLDAELKYNFSRHGLPSAWSLYANGYVTTNAYKGLKGFSAGIAFVPTNHGPVHWFPTRAEYEKELQYRAQTKEKWKIEKREKRAERIESREGLHFEVSGYAGRADRIHDFGAMGYFEAKKFILGMSFSTFNPTVSTRIYYPNNYPPGYGTTLYYRDKQREKSVFAGYSAWENNWFGLSIMSGLVMRRNIIDVSDEPGLYSQHYYRYQRTMKTGALIQLEESFTFENRNFGFGIIQFATFYKGYSSAGAAFSVRFGILR